MAITLTGANSQGATHIVGTVAANTCWQPTRVITPGGGGSFCAPGIRMTPRIERNRSRRAGAGRLSNVLLVVIIACVVMALEFAVNY